MISFLKAVDGEVGQTLYVKRKLLNSDDVISWAKQQGFKTTLLPDDMHVTIVFSKTPIDWSELQPSRDNMAIETDPLRHVEKLGDQGAVVLKFESFGLQNRWAEFKRLGASWDYPTYQPHVTISYDAGDLDLAKVKPYTGPLIFGPESFRQITPAWRDTVTEKTMPNIDEVMAYLKANAPEIAALVEKDATAGDVHAATSLGSKKKPTAEPAKDFKTLVEQARASGTLPDGVGKGEEDVPWNIPLDVIKAAPDQQLIFGWASVVEKNGVLVIDKQQDVILPADLETAAYDFVLYSRTGGDMHTRKGVSRLVESMVFTKQKQDILGIDLGIVGWWTGWKVDEPALWEAHKRGERPEFSIGGRGTRVAV